MAPHAAFVQPLSATAFTGRALSPSVTPTSPRPTAAPARRALRMADEKKPLFRNPFAAKPKQEQQATTFMEPQAGDPGFKPLPPVEKGFGMTKSEPRSSEAAASEAATPKDTAPEGDKPAEKKRGGKLPVVVGSAAKRGLALLREDILKNAPERAGVGRQDSEGLTMKPVAGEPGFKPQSFETVKVSDLGISPFPDDANAVGKVGGIEAVKKAAIEVKTGEKTAKEIKKEVLKIKTTSKAETKVFDIPDYLKPLPEDTPRKGLTWKNYTGR